MAEISRYHRVHKFENGATLLYFKHNLNNTTEYRVGYICGARKDKIPGTAHFLEHMLCNETENFSRNDYQQMFANMGVESNAFTTEKYITFFTVAPDSCLRSTLDINSRLLFNKEFNQESIDSEREAVKEEIRMYSGENQPDFLSELFRVSTNVMEGSRILGTEEDVDKITKEAFVDYIDENFVSENMIISVCSDLEFEEIKDMFEKYFVSKAKSNPQKRNVYRKTFFGPNASHTAVCCDDKQKTVDMEFLYRVNLTERENELYSFLEQYIFNGFNGRLLKNLRTKHALVYSSSFYTGTTGTDVYYKGFSILTSKNKVNKVIDVLGEILKDLCTNGISEQELNMCKQRIRVIEDEKYVSQKYLSSEQMLHRYLENQEMFYNKQIHSFQSLTLQEVNDFLKKIYLNNNVNVSISGDIDPETLYQPNKIQEILGAKQNRYFLDPIDNKYMDAIKGEYVSLDDIKNENPNLSDRQLNEEIGVYLYEDHRQPKLEELSYIDRINVLEATAKQLGIKLKIQRPTNTPVTQPQNTQEDNNTNDQQNNSNEQDLER